MRIHLTALALLLGVASMSAHAVNYTFRTASKGLEATVAPKVFAKWGTSMPASGATLSADKLTITTPSNGSNFSSAIADTGPTSGKWYWEVTLNSINNFGWSGAGGCTLASGGPNPCGIGWATDARDGGMFNTGIWAGTYNSTGAYGGGATSAVAVDYDAGKLWLRSQGAWIGGGNPAAGTAPTATFTPGTALYPMIADRTQVSATANFGETLTTKPFKYTVPTGFNPGLWK